MSLEERVEDLKEQVETIYYSADIEYPDDPIKRMEFVANKVVSLIEEEREVTERSIAEGYIKRKKTYGEEYADTYMISFLGKKLRGEKELRGGGDEEETFHNPCPYGNSECPKCTERKDNE